MKNIIKTSFLLCLCACLAVQFAGCDTFSNSEYCGGIVKGYKSIGETEIKVPFTDDEYFTAIEIEITFNEKSDKAYPYIIVTESFFDDYSCKTIDELFLNDDFKKAYSNAMVLEVKNGKTIFQMNKEFVLNSSIYFYEAVSEYNGLVKIDDLNNYIGYFNYN